jgi:hypothetical protein
MFTINQNCLNQNACEESDEQNLYYYYKGLDNLENNINNILKYNNIKKIFICGYRVNNTELFPFLNFLLKNDIETKELVFPSLVSNDLSIDIISKITKKINAIFYNIISDDNYEYKGFYYYKNNIYLFFDFTNCKLIINSIYKNSIIWPVLTDEIINKQNVCNIKINLDVTNFFNENIDFIFLKDKNEKIYEIPSVVYIGKEISKLNFTYIFGASKPNNNLLFGSYYYFTNFYNAIKEIIEENKRNKRNKESKENEIGIIRFALFTVLTKVILNNITDSVDKSMIKRELLENKNNLYENLTLRITDYDGNWTENYDSIYVGDIELDNGEKMKNTPIYVVKNYEQQIPLSYHFVDTTKDYEIL